MQNIDNKTDDRGGGNSMDKLGFNVHQILRYGYGGVLVFLNAYLIDAINTPKIIKSLGTTMSILTAVAIGAVIYTLYRPIFVEWLSAGVYEFIHKIFESYWGYINGEYRTHNCRMRYLEHEHSVNKYNCPNAFRLIRDNLFDKAKVNWFHIHHSEIHLLYITSFITFVGLIILLRGIGNPITNREILINYYIGFTVFFFIAGLICDISLCRRECAYLKTIPRYKIRRLLLVSGFTPIDPEKPTPKHYWRYYILPTVIFLAISILLVVWTISK